MDMSFILASIGVFLVTILVLVVILLVAKNFLVASGNVKLTINGDKEMEVESGSTLLNTLAVNGVFLPSACGGKGSCGQCKCQVIEGGGEILPSEVSHQECSFVRLSGQLERYTTNACQNNRRHTDIERAEYHH